MPLQHAQCELLALHFLSDLQDVGVCGLDQLTPSTLTAHANGFSSYCSTRKRRLQEGEHTGGGLVRISITLRLRTCSSSTSQDLSSIKSARGAQRPRRALLRSISLRPHHWTTQRSVRIIA